MLMTAMARVNIQDKTLCQLNFWQDWKIGQGRLVSNNIIAFDQQEQLSNVSAPIDQPGNIPRPIQWVMRN